MGWSLLVPAFMAGLAAIVVPVILHLRHREKDRPLEFPSLMFLERLPIRTAERRRITDLPLLLLRVLALALIALAFARPVFFSGAAAERARRSRAVVVMLDRSMSMSRTGVWDAATDSARRTVAALPADARVALVLFDDEAEIALPFTTEHAAVAAAIARARPTSRGTRYAAALRAARQLISRAPDATPEVVVITDLQRSGVSGVAGLDLPRNLQFRTIAVGSPDHANASVISVEIHRQPEAQRTMLSVQARVRARDGKAPRTVTVRYALNGREDGAKKITLPPSGDVVVPFDDVLLPGGQVRGQVSINTDALAADDTFHFAFTADDAVHLLLAEPDDAGTETLFLEQALSIGKSPVIHVERVRASQLSRAALDRANLVMLWDVPAPSGRGGDALADWVQRGGGLVDVMGRREPTHASATALVPATISGSVERLADHGGSLGQVRLDHPLFSPFRDSPGALSAARFLRYPALQAAPGADVLARFDDGAPAIVERRLGTGHELVVATALDDRSGDFPLQSAFLPFLQRLVLYGSGRDATTLSRSTGQSWMLPAGLKEPAVLTPAGAIVRPVKDSLGAAVALREAGVYALYDGRVAGEPAALTAVNPPAAESDLAPVDARELLLGVTQTASGVAAPGEQPTPVEVESRQRLWSLLLLAAGLLLLAETFMGNRGWRGTAHQLTPRQSEGTAG